MPASWLYAFRELASFTLVTDLSDGLSFRIHKIPILLVGDSSRNVSHQVIEPRIIRYDLRRTFRLYGSQKRAIAVVGCGLQQVDAKCVDMHLGIGDKRVLDDILQVLECTQAPNLYMDAGWTVAEHDHSSDLAATLSRTCPQLKRARRALSPRSIDYRALDERSG